MAFRIPLDRQAASPAREADPQALARVPAVAMSNLYDATAHALASARKSAEFAQQQTETLARAVTTMSERLLYSLDVGTPDASPDAAHSGLRAGSSR